MLSVLKYVTLSVRLRRAKCPSTCLLVFASVLWFYHLTPESTPPNLYKMWTSLLRLCCPDQACTFLQSLFVFSERSKCLPLHFGALLLLPPPSPFSLPLDDRSGQFVTLSRRKSPTSIYALPHFFPKGPSTSKSAPKDFSVFSPEFSTAALTSVRLHLRRRRDGFRRPRARCGGFHTWPPWNFRIFGPPPPLSLSQISWFCSFRLLFGDPPPPTHSWRHIWKPPVLRPSSVVILSIQFTMATWLSSKHASASVSRFGYSVFWVFCHIVQFLKWEVGLNFKTRFKVSSVNTTEIRYLQTWDMKRRPENRIEGATGCPSWCRPLHPLFHFLDDVSYPQSVVWISTEGSSREAEVWCRPDVPCVLCV